VIKTCPDSEEAQLALRDLKSIYIDMNRVEEYAALVKSLSGNNAQIDISEQDSLTYIAAERIYMRGDKVQAKTSFEKYLTVYPKGIFNLNAHYYLALLYQETKNYDLALKHLDYLMNVPTHPFYSDAKKIRQVLMVETLRSAYNKAEYNKVVELSKELLSGNNEAEDKSLLEEIRYDKAKALIKLGESSAAMEDLISLSKNTESIYGAEAKYLVADNYYKNKNYSAAEKELLNFIDESTPHAYWLARGFVLLSDVYVATGRQSEARQYLVSLQKSYKAKDDISTMINSRLNKLK
jgi:TolA-binding protein